MDIQPRDGAAPGHQSAGPDDPRVQALRAHLRPAIVAMDGPAASGKSTVGYRLAALLDFLFFDTGVMYRAVTWVALARGVDIQDAEAVGRLAETVELDVRPPRAGEEDGRHCTVLADGEDITWQIRAPEVDRQVSVVSAMGRVRRALTVQQRRIGQAYGAGTQEKAGIVMVGRDIGTVVFPQAPLKLYIDASAEERARRRHRELLARGKAVSFEEVLADMVRRDRLDSERDLSPLRTAPDALVIDTTGLTPDQVLERILDLACARLAVNP
ncbi:MAG: cytidylate kinase [Litorilinea sp.]|nr:MAG: cytidylate kinase [Litorilinea sp.]